jgi:hypothetical protein
VPPLLRPSGRLSSHEKPVAAQNPGTLGRSSSHSHLRIPRYVAIDTAMGLCKRAGQIEEPAADSFEFVAVRCLFFAIMDNKNPFLSNATARRML